MLGLTSVAREERRLVEKAREVLHFVGIESRKDELASSLAYGELRLLEVAVALAAGPTARLCSSLRINPPSLPDRRSMSAAESTFSDWWPPEAGERSTLAPDYLSARRVTRCPPSEHDVLLL
jgi:hypothetical protein